MPSLQCLPSTPSIADDNAYLLTRRRIYILPTRHGLSFCVVALVMLIGAVNYNNSLGYLLTFLLVSLALVSMLHAYRNLAGLSLKLRSGESVFAGEQMSLLLSVDNRGQQHRHDLCVSFTDSPEPGRTAIVVKHVSVPANAIARVELRATTQRRGWFRIGRVTVSTRFPLGLFRAWSNLSTDIKAPVYPTPLGAFDAPTLTSKPAQTDGATGQGNDDFAGLRSYAPGDAPGRIHWKSVAREQEVAVKLFTGASPAEVWLSWAETPGDGVEARLSQLAEWIQQAELNALSYRLDMPGESHGPMLGDSHRRTCLRSLALFGIQDG